MAPNRITPARSVRRALPLVLVALAVLVLAGCGGGSGPTTAVPDRNVDAEVMNELLTRQMAVVVAYKEALPVLPEPERAAARRFRGQEQEHVDATLKALRGLGDDAEPGAETIEAPPLRDPGDALRFLYEMESATIDLEVNAITRLTGDWPRGLVATMLGNQAQRLVLIRRGLGAKPLQSIPSAFEDGTTPAP
ncbi:MAG TPA: ferritin-like domain-containing protein [Solirubrobacterales bacterium]|nr:ferritin-like domain-containing protein [Solirubrobacterales bacterium]